MARVGYFIGTLFLSVAALLNWSLTVGPRSPCATARGRVEGGAGTRIAAPGTCHALGRAAVT
jgi:hypothetical protein